MRQFKVFSASLVDAWSVGCVCFVEKVSKENLDLEVVYLKTRAGTLMEDESTEFFILI